MNTIWKLLNTVAFLIVVSASVIVHADNLSYVACFDFQDPYNPDNHCTPLQSTPVLACEAYKVVFFERIPTRFEPGSGWVIDGVNASSPNDGGCFVDFAIHNIYSGQVVPHDTISSSGILAGIQTGYSLLAQPPRFSEPSSCHANNKVADPINPVNGAVVKTEGDCTSSSDAALSFGRFYNNTDTGNADLSGGWRHSYDRSVVAKYSTIESQIYMQSANTSSQYTNPAAACTGGFAEIQAKVSSWTGAISSYSGGNCELTKNGVSIGSVTVYSSGGSFAPAPTPVAYDVIRDDGQLIRFIVDGTGAIINPPGMSLKLQKTVSGFTVNDSRDNIEQYDANGKLLTVASRTGVIQTMSYDTSGRLNGVTDTFGHQVIMSYDAQGRLSTVTRQ